MSHSRLIATVVDHRGFVVDALAGFRIFAFRVLHLHDSKLLGLQARQFRPRLGDAVFPFGGAQPPPESSVITTDAS